MLKQTLALLQLTSHAKEVTIAYVTICMCVYVCIIVGHSQCLQLLLSQGADITATDDYGDTPMRVAERHGHHDCIQIIQSHLKH